MIFLNIKNHAKQFSQPLFALAGNVAEKLFLRNSEMTQAAKV